ncbi:hypothetical protein [Frigoriflavimonas asaccharolytica]|uniref:Uncharacterized protein n=1 Tax=Frigoriflavimonas asaccharolytica TaxID=2735899 RepID=A0A8J8G4S9_9FLAO|nr:hypothetical protein [Frigoriflavimonas asaccharolytica]NRS91071.1 hypothetical protein [Frigoriflavimonas asaccharolytica]
MADKIILKISSIFSIDMDFAIEDLNNVLKLQLKTLDKIVNYEEYDDKVELILDKMIISAKNNIPYLNAAKELNDLCSKHYQWDTFELELDKTKNQEFVELFNSFIKYKYENSRKKEKLRNRLILDGSTISLITYFNLKEKRFAIESPNQKSHPKLVRILKELMQHFNANFSINSKKM